MRITCVIHSLQGGGAERLLAGLANRLAATHQVSLLTLQRSEFDSYEVANNVQRRGLDLMGTSQGLFSGLRNNVRRIRVLRRAIAASQPDVVLSFCDQTNVLTLAACIGLQTSRGSLPVVISEHTDPRHQPLPRPWAWLRKKLYPRAAAAIALTSATAAVVAAWTGSQVTVIPPAIDRPQQPITSGPITLSDSANTAEPAPEGRFRWLCLGRLSWEKGFERALAAFAQAAEQFPLATLTIAGEGAERERLQALAAELGVTERVDFTGWVTDVPALLANHGGFLLSSHYEGFPLSLLEAMSRGLACVAMDCQSGPSEVLRDGQNGRLVPAGDVSAMTVAMRQIMSDPQLAQRLGAAARALGPQFDWPAFTAAHESLLKAAAEIG
ncbi:glycosyltransferase [Planctomycetaceae bacterium SH139]